MIVKRVSVGELPIFKTFDIERKLPEFIDIETMDGDLSLIESLPNQGLAIVGTRYPQGRSVKLLEKTMRDLSGSGLVIISGLARGIDSRAHELALEYGLKTIAILGCGIDRDYPRENRILRNRILNAGGMIISQFEVGAEPYAGNFIERNRLVAGFASATWVVEGGAISGTLNTATWTIRMNRELYATSCFPGDHYYQGNEKLLSQRNNESYPIAFPFFSAESFSFLWPCLRKESQPKLRKTIVPKSTIQKWVLELKQAHGKCEVQALMNYAYAQGLTLGAFYLEFEKELDSGLITQDILGEVEANL